MQFSKHSINTQLNTFGLVTICNSTRNKTHSRRVYEFRWLLQGNLGQMSESAETYGHERISPKPGSVSSLATTNPPALNDSVAEQLVVVIYL